MVRLPNRWRWWALVAGAVVLVALALVVGRPAFRSYTGRAPPDQFYRAVQLDPALSGDYRPILGVAHNAGNNPGTSAAALRAGADVIEIDVISARGRLVAGREQTWQWLAARLFRGPTLLQAWDDAAGASAVKLDLKQSGQGFLTKVVAFLRPRMGTRQVLVTSGDPRSLEYLHSQLPDTRLFFSVSGPDAVALVHSDQSLQRSISGVSVFEGLVDRSLVTWVHQRHLQILVWTVNDSKELNRMVGLGVDGITSANLAVLRALG